MTERMIIVDQDDNIIEHKSRSDFAPTDRIRISAIWVVNSMNESLIAQRSHHKTNQPLLWGPAAAGTLEEGESYLQNAVKELEEEIGVAGVTLQEIAKVKWDEPNELRFCQTYKVTIDWPIEKFKIQEEEVEAVKWVPTEWLLEDIKVHPELYLNSSYKWASLFDLVE